LGAGNGLYRSRTDTPFRALDFESNAGKLQAAESSTLTPTPPETLSPHLSVNPENDPDLTAIVDAWPMLPADVRKMIAGVVRATLQASGQRK